MHSSEKLKLWLTGDWWVWSCSLGVALTASLGVVLTVDCLEGIRDCDFESMIGCGHGGM